MDDIQVFSQWTPNPDAYKFITSEFVINKGKASFSDLDQCEHIPMVTALLLLTGVLQVHLYENVMTITQNGEQDWGELSDKIETLIKQFLPHHDIAFEREVAKNREGLAPDVLAIEELLDRTIRPGLQGDGGDVEVVDYSESILTIRYEGACGTCPSAMEGTLAAIRGIMRDEFNPDTEVVVI